MLPLLFKGHWLPVKTSKKETNRQYNMMQKELYSTPAVVAIAIETDATILENSAIDLNIETVDTIGQESYNVTQDALTHEWK